MEIKDKRFDNNLRSVNFFNILQIKKLGMWNLIDFRQIIIGSWTRLCNDMLNELNVQKMLFNPDWTLPFSAEFSN